MSDAFYQPPAAEALPAGSVDRKRGRGMAVASLLLLFSPVVLIVVIAVDVFTPIRVLQETGQADPKAFAEQTSRWIAVGLTMTVLSFIGVVLASIGLLGAGNREGWFKWLLLCVTILQLLLFPTGTVLAVFLAIFLIMRWKEFRPHEAGAGCSGNGLERDAPATEVGSEI